MKSGKKCFSPRVGSITTVTVDASRRNGRDGLRPLHFQTLKSIGVRQRTPKLHSELLKLLLQPHRSATENAAEPLKEKELNAGRDDVS